MFRKLILALGAVAAIGVVALSPTAASAKHWHHWHYWYGGYHPYYASDCYIARQVYWDVFGKHVRHVRVCN